MPGAWFRVFSRYLVSASPLTVYSFEPIHLKLYRCFNYGQKICMCNLLNPQVNFFYFFHIFNLDIFLHSSKFVVGTL